MKGKRVERVWGWDCHGLPAENLVEKKLGIKDKRDVQKIGLDKYINTCRESMVQIGNEWEDTIDRIGRWVDFKGAYKTMDKEYMESVWWAFKTLYEKGKIYEGEKVLLYCTRCATPLSKAEIAMDNSYQDVTDPSVYIKFKLTDDEHSLLAWTTTPWTLPANTAVAVNKDLTYAKVVVGSEKLIIAQDLLKEVLVDEKNNPLEYKIEELVKGKELVGKTYIQMFENHGEDAHRVLHAGYVNLEEGTGIVHLAPAYGEEDYELSKSENIPVISVVDENGFYTSGTWKGEPVWNTNKQIAKDLLKEGIVWKIKYLKHSYPHCHRCGTRLMYRAHPSWFMNVADQRQQMLEENGGINWYPEHFKHGRFQNIVETAPDWNISRDRFWATAMPVWKATDKNGKEKVKVIGSYKELKELSGVELNDYHRPWIDEVEFEIDGLKYKRIDKVLDGWLDSGSMSFAQFHYPFENVEKFEENFPGDFIAEYVAQVRAWFYYMHTVSVGLFNKKSFKNVIVTGTLSGNDGRKMSKSFGNYTDPNILMDEYSADALRFLLISSPLLNGEDYSLVDKNVADVFRKLNMVWNMYDFFTLYADVDGWEWDGDLNDPYDELENVLDKWIISRIHELNQKVNENMEKYDLQNATKDIIPFIDDASNWYIRRSRKRFWKSDNDSDKSNAYRTLHYLLVQLSLIISPFVPFMSEELYTKLTECKSVHLQDWPVTGHVNGSLINEMRDVRDIVNTGLNLRSMNAIKVRQPLQSATINTNSMLENDFLDIVKEELNVKKVNIFNRGDKVVLDTTITESLKLEGIARDVIRQIQETRKKAGLEVDDRIKIKLDSSNSDVSKAIAKFQSEIYQETLATNEPVGQDVFVIDVKVNTSILRITLEKDV